MESKDIKPSLSSDEDAPDISSVVLRVLGLVKFSVSLNIIESSDIKSW